MIQDSAQFHDYEACVLFKEFLTINPTDTLYSDGAFCLTLNVQQMDSPLKTEITYNSLIFLYTQEIK